MKKIGVIGIGSMGSALTEALCKKLAPEDVAVYDRGPAKISAIVEKTGCAATEDAKGIAADCEIVMLAVQPQNLRAVLQSILPTLKENYDKGIRQVVLSIAASWTLEEVEAPFAAAEMTMPVVRLMPNIPLRVGQGMLIFCHNESVTDAEMDEIMSLFEMGGLCENGSEELMPLISTIGCTPAMTYMFIESIADACVQCGLDRNRATRFAAQSVLGSAAMVLQSGKHIGQLKDELSTPAGMTIGGTNLMEVRGFRGATIEGVVRCYDRQFDMSK